MKKFIAFYYRLFIIPQLQKAQLTRGNHCGKLVSWQPFSLVQDILSTPYSCLTVMLQCLKNSIHFPFFSPYCTSDGDCVVEPMSQEEVVVVPDWECWAANWARAWAVLNCSKNWEPVVLPLLASLTSPNPFPNMLTCKSTQRLEKSIANNLVQLLKKTLIQGESQYKWDK